MKLIESKTLATAAASIEFTSIPQTYTDLVLLISARTDFSTGAVQGLISFNSDTSNFSSRYLLGSGSAASSGTLARYIGQSQPSTYTANTFTNKSVYIPNYTSSTSKSYSVDSVEENNATLAYQDIVAGLWTGTSAISSIQIGLSGGNYVAGSTISLYGILKGSDGIVTTS